MVNVIARDLSGIEVARWQAPDHATPGATPVTAETIQSGDRIVWNQQSSHAIVGIEDVGVFVADKDLNLTPIAPTEPTSLTAVAWVPTGQSVALASWDSSLQAARILTASLQDLSRLTLVLELAEGDGRFVRSIAWGNEGVGLVFALRSLNAGSSFPSDLYHLPRFGQPMRLLATAGAAAPAAVVDQIAIAGNGSTIAYTVLIPGEVGFRFHSLWITDAEAPDPIRIDTPGVRRVTDLVWTSRGLALIGTRREATGDTQTQASVVELVTMDGLTTIAAVRSEATPVGSPQTSPDASPTAGTPATE
jgi:dipeptidyl aminopeptidase/acylaminoacyl peptidase